MEECEIASLPLMKMITWTTDLYNQTLTHRFLVNQTFRRTDRLDKVYSET